MSDLNHGSKKINKYIQRRFTDLDDGTEFATPSEFVCHLLREKKERQDAEAERIAILEGYQDAVSGRTVAFKGNLRGVMQKAKR